MRVLVSLVAVAVAAGGALPARAAARNDYLDGAHWDVAARDGQPAVLTVVDGTDDPRVQEALRAFKADWNAMRAAPALRLLPAVDITTARAAQACSRPGLQAAAAASARVVVCIDDALASAAVGGPFRVDAKGHTTLAVVKLRTATLAWSACGLRTAVAHELGHAMGLAHNDGAAFVGGPSLMMSRNGPYRYGCPAWFNAHDREALRALYQQHAASCRSDASI